MVVVYLLVLLLLVAYLALLFIPSEGLTLLLPCPLPGFWFVPRTVVTGLAFPLALLFRWVFPV